MAQRDAKMSFVGLCMVMLLWVPALAQAAGSMPEGVMFSANGATGGDGPYAAVAGDKLAQAGAVPGGRVSQEGEVRIADPIEPFNRLMFTFNDRLYFWVLKPVAQGYSFIIAEGGRVAVRNVFHNIRMPIRLVNALLQLKFEVAGKEMGRFLVNTSVGLGGLFDVDPELRSPEEDFDQTLGVWGLGQGFYIVWPFLGPSSLRGAVGLAGDYFLDPISYVSEGFLIPEDADLGAPAGTSYGIRVFEIINATSLRIGDYEDLKKAALDPYVALRNAYAQNRKKKVEE